MILGLRGRNSTGVGGLTGFIIEAFLTATLKYHSQMGKDNNLAERPTLSIEFHLPKRGCIYGFGTPLPRFSLSL